MKKATPIIQSTQNTNTNEAQFLAHFAIVGFAVFGSVLNLFTNQMWDGVKQLGSVPGRMAGWLKVKLSDMGLSILQQRESNS
ncbi:MAG: hypothetical protein U5K27_14625 [Desulfotignum sp.]|nr:hypothetical protein [Desulfotignum sp.]